MCVHDDMFVYIIHTYNSHDSIDVISYKALDQEVEVYSGPLCSSNWLFLLKYCSL